MLKKAAALFLAGVSLATWTSCGKVTNQYLFAAISGASQIGSYREDPNSGVLTLVTGSPFTAGMCNPYTHSETRPSPGALTALEFCACPPPKEGKTTTTTTITRPKA